MHLIEDVDLVRSRKVMAYLILRSQEMANEFTQFEHRAWQRVADKYDSTWSSSTRQFIPPLLDAAEVGEKMPARRSLGEGGSILDIGSGPGYVAAAAAERGAIPIGLDFSSAMVAIAREKFPHIEFREGDAQNLPFGDESFDRVVTSFALLHVAEPERVMSEACRVLKRGGRFAFTTWARKEENTFVRLIDDAIQAHAKVDVDLPPGPPFYLYENEESFRDALSRAGFDGASMKFKRHTIQWQVPSADFVFDAETKAGVRTAGLLAQQSPEALRAIKAEIAKALRAYSNANGFAIPKTAYIVAAAKR
jgi:ubiquinone/menaquinone biosynthesis C-methylase UbiE